MDPRVCIGMFTYNEATHVGEALGSLLGQTYRDFRLIVLDDCSTDETERIILRYAERDPRIAYFRNPRRMGYAANYRRTFQLAGPAVDYFAWAAGHDQHHPRWLEVLVRVLREFPDVVMAYPLTVRISKAGERLDVPSPVFQTVGQGVFERMRTVCYQGVGFGNAIYGLFRADALRKAGVFHRVLLPDVLLLTQLSLFGSFHQVHEELWFRRSVAPPSLARQKRTVFANTPWYAHMPWPLVNSVCLGWYTVVRLRAGGLKDRLHGMRLTLMHLHSQGVLYARIQLARIGWLKKLYRTFGGVATPARSGTGSR